MFTFPYLAMEQLAMHPNITSKNGSEATKNGSFLRRIPPDRASLFVKSCCTGQLFLGLGAYPLKFIQSSKFKYWQLCACVDSQPGWTPCNPWLVVPSRKNRFWSGNETICILILPMGAKPVGRIGLLLCSLCYHEKKKKKKNISNW